MSTNAPSRKKSKKKLDSSTNYIALGIVLGGIVVVLAVVLPLTFYFVNKSKSEDDTTVKAPEIPDLPTMVARTDELEKDLRFMGASWHWESLNNRRPKLPIQADGGNLVVYWGENKRIPKEKERFEDIAKAAPAQLPNVKLNKDQLTALQKALGGQAGVLNDAHNLPSGGTFVLPTTYKTKDEQGKEVTSHYCPYDIPRQHIDHLPRLVQLLYADGLVKLDQGNLTGADQNFNAIMKLAGYLRFIYFPEIHLERIKAHTLALDLLERMLAQSPSIPEEMLENYQKKLQFELNYNDFLEMVRAERGLYDMTCGLVRSNKISMPSPRVAPPSGMPGGPGGMPGGEGGMPGGEGGMPGGVPMPGAEGGMPGGAGGMPGGGAPMPAPPMPGGPGMPGMGMPGGGAETNPDEPNNLDLSNAWFLQYMNEITKIAKGPTSKYLDGIKKWNNDSTKPPAMATGFVPECDKWAAAYLKKVARMRSAVVAIACERFRLAKNQWPATLKDLSTLRDPELDPKLPDSYFMKFIPNDPFTDRDLIYRPGKNGEGMVIYSVGLDRVDNQVLFEGLNVGDEKSDIGFRLFEVGKRQP